MRGLLDKIGVKPDFLTEGAYKSAAELFMREQPSPEADEMMNWLMDSWYASFKEQIAQGRKADAAKVQGWLDNGLFTAEQAKASGLIDAVEQLQDFEAMLKERYGQDVRFERRYGRKSQRGAGFRLAVGLRQGLDAAFRRSGESGGTQAGDWHRLCERPDPDRERQGQPVRGRRGGLQQRRAGGLGEGGSGPFHQGGGVAD